MKIFIKIFTFFIILTMLVQTNFAYAYIEKDTKYVWSDNTVETSAMAEEDEDFLDLSCESAILISQDTGEVLYESNPHEKLRPASVTKIMTILLIMEEIDSGNLSYDDMVSCSENASKMGGSQIWLDTRESLSVDEMLKAICVVSANDCTVAMAEHICGSEEVFVEKMNQKAKDLGMNDTTFKNCHGIDEDGHVSSSYDIAVMSRELLSKHPDVMKYTKIWMDSLRDGKSELVNTNKLIKNYEGATGLKTGSTSLALFNLSASATRDGLSLIAVVMRAPSTKERFNCAKKLLDYGFSNYQYKKFSEAGENVMNVPVQKGINSEVALSYSESSGKMISKNDDVNVEQEVVVDENIQAPIHKGQELGMVNYKIAGNVVQSVSLVANEDVEKINFFNMGKKIISKWFYLFRT